LEIPDSYRQLAPGWNVRTVEIAIANAPFRKATVALRLAFVTFDAADPRGPC
jgi:hypothetical protein